MFKSPQHLVILTAPPASGKTYWIALLAEKLSSPILVISPLRALADECKEKWGEKISVMTPEEWLLNKISYPVVIFDEFHLFFYWGDSFRPKMWEVFYEIVDKAQMTFLLTATLSKAMIAEITLYACHFDHIQWVNCGNQILKYKPQLYIKAYSSQWMVKLIETQCEGVNLIFCKYREEVFAWEKRLKKRGFSVVSCVGGGAKEMRDKLNLTPQPDFIVCTTVLSHGVNLPEIRKIFFLYAVKNTDFWIQMVARGGRKGEKFEVFSLENPEGINWNPWTNFLAILLISFKMMIIRNLRPTWFLKD